MYVVIAGGGRIGRYIARDMERKGHDVTVVEWNFSNRRLATVAAR